MKIAYLKIQDPIEFKKPDAVFTDDDKDLFKLVTTRVVGILINETDKTITIGEVTIAEDNPEHAEFGVRFPQYRYIMTVSKTNIIERQDFEVK